MTIIKVNDFDHKNGANSRDWDHLVQLSEFVEADEIIKDLDPAVRYYHERLTIIKGNKMLIITIRESKLDGDVYFDYEWKEKDENN